MVVIKPSDSCGVSFPCMSPSESKESSTEKVYACVADNGEAYVFPPGARRSASGVWRKGGVPTPMKQWKSLSRQTMPPLPPSRKKLTQPWGRMEKLFHAKLDYVPHFPAGCGQFP